MLPTTDDGPSGLSSIGSVVWFMPEWYSAPRKEFPYAPESHSFEWVTGMDGVVAKFTSGDVDGAKAAFIVATTGWAAPHSRDLLLVTNSRQERVHIVVVVMTAPGASDEDRQDMTRFLLSHVTIEIDDATEVFLWATGARSAASMIRASYSQMCPPCISPYGLWCVEMFTVWAKGSALPVTILKCPCVVLAMIDVSIPPTIGYTRRAYEDALCPLIRVLVAGGFQLDPRCIHAAIYQGLFRVAATLVLTDQFDVFEELETPFFDCCSSAFRMNNILREPDMATGADIDANRLAVLFSSRASKF